MGCLENDRKYAGKWFVNSLAQFLVNFFTRLRAAFFLNHFQQQICIVVGLVSLLARARVIGGFKSIGKYDYGPIGLN